jgi:hypothetical protein
VISGHADLIKGPGSSKYLGLEESDDEALINLESALVNHADKIRFGEVPDHFIAGEGEF